MHLQVIHVERVVYARVHPHAVPVARDGRGAYFQVKHAHKLTHLRSEKKEERRSADGTHALIAAKSSNTVCTKSCVSDSQRYNDRRVRVSVRESDSQGGARV